MFKVNNKGTGTTPGVNFEQVNAGWVFMSKRRNV